MRDIVKGTWIYFSLITFTGKTYQYRVCANDGTILGEVKFYPHWRKYSFFPQPNTLYEIDCLREIVLFLDKLGVERKIQAQNKKQKTI